VFTKTIITSSVVSPYVITIADIGKRLQVNAAASGAIDLATSASSFATGDTLQVAAYGAPCSLYPNNTLDFAYDPNANDIVYAVGIQSDGKAIIGGTFTTVSGSTRNRIARINTNGTLDTTYNPNASDVNSRIQAIAIQSDGKAIMCGYLVTVSGSARNHIARINTDGSLDLTYNPNANSEVHAIAIQSDGKAIIGGYMNAVSGSTRNYIARINTDGAVDLTYDPDLADNVRAIAIQSDGKAIIGGNFTTVSGSTLNRIARINTNGTPDLTYNPNVNNYVFAIAIQSDGKAIIGGNFTTVSGSTRNRIARLNTNGSLDLTYNPNANSEIYAIAIQSDGKAIIGGYSATVSGSNRNRLARINTDGAVDLTYDPNVDRTTTAGLMRVTAIAIQSDGKAIIGGDFTTASAAPRNRIARINTSGSAVTLRAPYTLPAVQVPQYAVLTLEKTDVTSTPSSSGEWWVINSNAS